MINGSDSVSSLLRESFSSVDGLMMYISSVLYFFAGVWLFLFGVDNSVLPLICFFMVILIFLLYVSLLVFSSDGRGRGMRMRLLYVWLIIFSLINS